MITYKYKGNLVDVLLEARKVGIIKKVESGWRYFPQGKKKFAGDVFPNLIECQKSLEGEPQEST